MRSPPTAAEPDRISVHAVRIALKNKATECRCPFSGKGYERREHSIQICRRWCKQDVLIAPEARQQSLSIAVVSEIILKAFKFVHSRRSGGSAW